MASELPVRRQNGTQSAQRRDPGTPNDYQIPPLESLDLALGPPTELHSGDLFNVSLFFGTPGLDLGSPRVPRDVFGNPGASILEVFPITFWDPRKLLGSIPCELLGWHFMHFIAIP